MSDKFLTESEWKRFAKGRGYKDDALIKGLWALEKAKDSDQELAALADIEKQAEALRKAAKGDKELGAYLDSLEKAADKQRKLSEAEAKKAEQSEEEEEESPTLLTTKMIPLLRQVKKGEEMQVMLASTGKEVAVLMSRRSITPTRRKLLAEYLDGGAPKYFLGTCIFEEKAYTFVLKTQAAGLAKKVKAALLKQVELRLKVRVRGEDPNDIDDDGEPADGNEGLEAEGEEGTAGVKGDIPPPPPPPPLDPLKVQFDKRWPDLQARTLERLKAGAGDVSKIRAVAEFVREKGEGGNYKAALQGMDSLEKLLPVIATPQSPPPPGGADPAAAFTARLTALMPAIKSAIAAGGETGQDIKLKVGEAGVFARKKEFDRANALLDEAEKLLGGNTEETPKSEISGSGTESEPQQTEDEAPLTEAELRAILLEAIKDVATQAALLSPEAKLKILEKAKEGQALLKGSDLNAAQVSLSELQDLLYELQQAAREEELERVNRAQIVYSALRKRWDGARETARSGLASLRDTIMADDDMVESDDFDQVMDIANSLEDVLPDFGDDVDDILNELDDEDDEGRRKQLHGEALAKLNQAIAKLEGADTLRKLQDWADEAYGSMELFRPLDAALKDMRKRLEARA
jgi:hypothetical protein